MPGMLQAQQGSHCGGRLEGGGLREIVGCQVSSGEMGLARVVGLSARPLRAVLG